MCSTFAPIYLSEKTQKYIDDGIKAKDADIRGDAEKLVEHNRIYEDTCGAG
jgi:hypothetical protein